MITIDLNSLHSKVARRIVAVFLLCAVFPFAALAFVSYFQVTTYFNEQNQRQLHEVSKSVAMDLYARLSFLEAELKVVASSLKEPDNPTPVEAYESLGVDLKRRFKALAWIREDGRRVPLYGAMEFPPGPTLAQKEHLDSGKSLLSSLHSSHDLPAPIFLSRKIDPTRPGLGILIGQVNDNYFWGVRSLSRWPAQMEYCVLDESDIALMCALTSHRTLPPDIAKKIIRSSSGDFEWEREGKKYMATYWTLPLKYPFHVPGWTVLLQRPKENVFAPLGEFKHNLVLMALLSLAVALLLGIRLIRTRLVPIEKLQEGTRRIANQDFGFRVNVSSGDEFEELAKLFNAMAGQLGSQFQTLATVAEIDRAILSLLDTDKIVETVLTRMVDVFPCDGVSLSLSDPNEKGIRETYAVKENSDKIGKLSAQDTRGVDVENPTGSDATRLAWGEERREFNSTASYGLAALVAKARAPLTILDLKTDPRIADSDFLRKHDFVSCLAVPLTAKGSVLGVLSFYTKEQHEFTKDEVEFLTAQAEQAAIAIHNAQLFERTKDQALDLEKSNKLKDEFLGVVSHELRTPLNIVLGYTRMLQTESLGKINPDQAGALEKVTKHSHELLTMIESIMDATKIEAGAVTVESREVNLTAFLDDLKSRFSFPLGKELVLNWNYPSDLPSVKTDEVKLGRVIQNLIDNAIKFTDKGRVAVSALYVREKSSVCFKVTDTGIGIPEESLPVIFEMFRQIDSSKTREHNGVGLGLYIARKLAALIGGKIEVESKPGAGSTFTLTLSAAQQNRMVA